MNLEIPKGWILCKIGEVTQIISGGTPSSQDKSNFRTEGGIGWITPADLSGYRNIYVSHGARNLSEKGYDTCSAKKIPKGSVLFSSRAPIGYVAIAGNELTTSQGFKSFILTEELDSRYIYFYLKYITPVAKAMATGTTFKELSGKAISQLPLLVAPLNEQKRIADKLEMLIEEVNICKEMLDRVSLTLRLLRQSIIEWAVSGKLTEAWRSEAFDKSESSLFNRLQRSSVYSSRNFKDTNNSSRYTLPENWLYVPVQEVGKVFLGRQRSPKNHTGSNMHPYVRAANISWKGWNLSDVKAMNFDPGDFSRYKLQVGDILINEGSGSIDEVGKSAVWKGEIENCCFQNTLICVRPFEEMSEYLHLVFLDAALSKAFARETRGIGIHHMGKERLAKFLIPLPPIEEQQEIVRQANKLLAYTDSLEILYQQAKGKIELFVPKLLDMVFRGELVQQTSTDELASNLLEKLLRQKQELGNPSDAIMNNRKVQPKKQNMSKIGIDSVKQVISQLPDDDSFSFDEIYRKIPISYEQLKEIIFDLLNEENPVFTQVFNEVNATMCFMRSHS
jgi:type I restriction enzyme, S subunit